MSPVWWWYPAWPSGKERKKNLFLYVPPSGNFQQCFSCLGTSVSVCVSGTNVQFYRKRTENIKAVFLLSVAQYFKLYCVPVRFRKVPLVGQHIPRNCYIKVVVSVLQKGKINFALRFVTWQNSSFLKPVTYLYMFSFTSFVLSFPLFLYFVLSLFVNFSHFFGTFFPPPFHFHLPCIITFSFCSIVCFF